MPPPPNDAAPAPSPAVPLLSPRAAAERVLVYRRGKPERRHSRWLRVIALALSLLVHLALLLGILLGPVYVPPLPPRDDAPLLVRLIDLTPEPPPPPAVRGTPPKQRGPLQRSRQSAAARRVTAAKPAHPRAPAKAVAATPAPAQPSKKAVVAKPPAPASQPSLQPVPLVPPAIALAAPTLTQPVPPRFQPEPVRKPTTEGNQPMPPPPSLADAVRPPQAPPRASLPNISVTVPVRDVTTAASAAVARPQVTTGPPTPALPPVPSVSQPAAPVPTLETEPQPPAITAQVTDQRPEQQRIDVRPAEPQPAPELAGVPIAPLSSSKLEQPAETASPAVESATAPIDMSVARSQLSESAPSTDTATPSANTPDATAAQSSEQTAASAPDANAQGRDTAKPGAPDGVDQAPPIAAGEGRTPTNRPGHGRAEGAAGKAAHGSGTLPGSAQGSAQGALGTFIQVKPHGDTDIMQHRAANIGYKPTRFEQDWAPQNETILDTALRHAVERTTVSHTFHLPRGVRIKCVVMPLFPMVMLGCGNPDPPARPLDQAIYNRLNLAPATPLVPPLPASATTIASPAVRLDDSVPCANARVAGGPLPPGCAPVDSSLKPAATSASSSSSWVPPSDQFQ